MPLHDYSHVISSPPPGFEIAYAQITAAVNVTGTSSGAATTVISPGAILFDGTPVLVTVSCPQILCDTNANGDLFAVSLFEGATELGMIARARSVSAANPLVTPVSGMYRFTPTAGFHTYTVACYVTANSGPAIFNCGSGGTNALLPAFVRFTKV